MTEPTEAERAVAEDVAERGQCRGQKVLVKLIAQALADQRAKYEAVADELDNDDYEPGFDASPDYWGGRSDGARAIRRVATE